MHGFQVSDFARSCALMMLCCAVARSAEADRRAPQAGANESFSTSERLTREGLLAGIDGAAESRDTALRRAISISPDYALARWHLGQLRLDDQWLSIAQAEERMSEDTQLAEYRELRDAVSGDSRRELGLARWCRRQRIHDTERLHLRRVLANESSEPTEKKQAADRLGLREYQGGLLTETEIKRLEAEFAKQREDQAKWSPIVEKWRTMIESGPGRKRSFALEQLHGVRDPASIPTLELLLSPRSEELALEVVSVLGSMPEYEATQSLARHAVAPWDSVRDAVVQQLERRPLHDFAPLLLRQLVAPVQSRFYVRVGLDGLVRHQHDLFREGPHASHLLSGSYVGGPVAVTRTKKIPFFGQRPATQAARDEVAKIQKEQARQRLAAAAIRSMVVKQESARARQIEQDVANTNTAIAQQNDRMFEVLERTSGEMLTRSPSAWWDWWQDYNEVYREEKPTFTYQVGHVDPYYVPYTSITRRSCFPAGTKVRGETGLMDIEHVQPGDRVLSQNVETGELAYKLVTETTERPPSALLRITLGNGTITTTKGHPFWVNNVGWRMAKRLEVGQQLHSVAGSQTIDRIEDAAPAKAYNLVVADFGAYFVGDPGVFVHDNTYRKPTMALTPGLLARHTAAHIDDATTQ